MVHDSDSPFGKYATWESFATRCSQWDNGLSELHTVDAKVNIYETADRKLSTWMVALVGSVILKGGVGIALVYRNHTA